MSSAAEYMLAAAIAVAAVLLVAGAWIETRRGRRSAPAPRAKWTLLTEPPAGPVPTDEEIAAGIDITATTAGPEGTWFVNDPNDEPNEDTYHVWPVNDVIEHTTTGDDCICGPTLEVVPRDDGTTGWLTIHHSLDGRELKEGE